MLKALSPAPVIVLVHRGRASGRVYKTPVEILSGEEGGEVVVAPMWGTDSDWYRNVVAGGLIEVHIGDRVRTVDWRELPERDRRTAIEAYRTSHPRYSRIILATLVRIHDLRGDPEEAVLRELPMLGLRMRD